MGSKHAKHGRHVTYVVCSHLELHAWNTNHFAGAVPHEDCGCCAVQLAATGQFTGAGTLDSFYVSLYMYKSKFTVDYCNHNQIYQYVPPTLPLSLDLSLRSAYAEGERKPRPQLSSNYIYINRSQHVTTQLCTRECLEKWKHEISPTIPCDN